MGTARVALGGIDSSGAHNNNASHLALVEVERQQCIESDWSCAGCVDEYRGRAGPCAIMHASPCSWDPWPHAATAPRPPVLALLTFDRRIEHPHEISRTATETAFAQRVDRGAVSAGNAGNAATCRPRTTGTSAATKSPRVTQAAPGQPRRVKGGS